MPFCPSCGAKVSENAGFCPKCGGRLVAVEQTVKGKSRGKLAGIIVGCVIAIIVLAVTLTHLYGPNVGGVYLIYQADLSQVAVGSEAQAMQQVRQTIERRINSWGITQSTIQIGMQEGYYGVSIELPGVTDMEGAKRIIGRTGLLEFREQVLNATGNMTWVIAKAIGSNGTEEELTGKYLKPNASVVLEQQTNQVEVAFEFNAQGAVLFKNITTRNLNKPLGIFLDNQLISAPTVQAVIEAKGVIQGAFNLSEANTLAIQLNSGAMPVSLGRWVEQGNSRVFEANVPLYEGLETPP